MTAAPSPTPRARAVVHSRPTTWTPAADAKIRQMRGDGATLAQIARHFGIANGTVAVRVRALGLPIIERVKPASPRPKCDTRAPLPAGHPISWDLVTRGTSMAGCRYPVWGASV